MKILIEARALSARGGGVKTYTQQLIKHLLEIIPGDDVAIIYDQGRVRGIFHKAHERVVKMYHPSLLPVWLQWQVPRAIGRVKPDLVHFTKADVSVIDMMPRVVTIYDVIPLLFPESQSWLRRRYWPRALKRAAKYSDKIITISNASQTDIVRMLGVDVDKVVVTPLAVDTGHWQPVTAPDRLAESRRKYNIKTPYILFVGTRDPRKNVGGLLRSFAAVSHQIPHQLIIIGKPAVRDDGAVAEASRLGIRNRVQFINFVEYADLPAIYSGADLFVWPSVYEGWGFPPLEAMACGVPTIVSNGGALPEVVGEAAVVVPFFSSTLAERRHDPKFEQQLSIRINEVLGDADKQSRMRRAGFEQVNQFSWGQVAQQTLEVYKSVL